MTAQELKNSILQYAVQGKLVPQDPSDEPASVLLERIKAEKAQLIKDKKIKAEKPLAPITEEEIPFEIPESWVWVRLGDVSTKITDGSHNPPPNSLTGIPILSAANINQNKVLIETATRWVTESQWAVENKRTEISINDVLLTIVGTIGRSAVVESNAKFALQRSVCVIKPVFLFSKYLALFLQSPISLDKMKDKTQGTAQLGIYLNSIKNLIFPLPPLAEQQRIVAKIEELMPLVEEYDKAEKELTDLNAKFPEQIKKSVLQYAIQGKLVPQDPTDEPASVLLERIKAEKAQLINEKKIKAEKPLAPITEEEIPFEIPESWVWCRLGEIVVVNPRNSIDNSLNVSFIPMTLIGQGYENSHTSEVKIWKDIKSGFTHFAENDIAIAKITPCFENRKSVIFKNLINGYGAGTTELHVLRTISNTLDEKYLLLYCKSEMFIKEGVKSFTGTAGQQRIGKDYIVNCRFPLPPLAEQQRIVEKVEEVLGVCEGLKA